MYTQFFKSFLFLLAACLILAACDEPAVLAPFSSDGCSLFPDSSMIVRQDWCECCFEHDIAYWRGGTNEERRQADLQLKACVLAKTSDEALATLMYEGVRFGGSPYFYNWYRWGYGWPYDRKYKALTPKEGARADELLDEYFQKNKSSYCTL